MAFGRPQPLPYVDEEDLLDLAYDLGAGWIPTAELYLAYVETIYRQEKRRPIPKRAFGEALEQAGWRAENRYLNGATTRCRLVTRSWERRGQAKHGAAPEPAPLLDVAAPIDEDPFISAEEADDRAAGVELDRDWHGEADTSLEPDTWDGSES